MDLTDDEVREIMRLVEESSFDFLQINSGELNLTISKGGRAPEPWNPPASQAAAPAPAAAPNPAPVATPAPEEAPAPAPEAPVERTYGPGIVPVAAPMVGTFYAAPDPESPPFVEVGAKVGADTTVGLIEVMKVFTSIRAGVDGTIEEVLVENAQAVVRGQHLFAIKT